MLDEAVSKIKSHEGNRIIRCIIFLGGKDVEKLKRNIDVALYDYRDVMLRAEYLETGNPFHPKRIRGFSKPFDECETDVKE
jgi:hypothetical protein